MQRDVKQRLDAAQRSRNDDNARARRDRSELHPFTIAGAVLLPLAGVGAGLMIAGLVTGNRAVDDYRDGPTRDDRDAARQRGRVGNGLAIGGGIAAASFAVVGTVLIVLGQRKQNDTRARVSPGFAPGVALLVLDGRF
jgi:hypothetical protein